MKVRLVPLICVTRHIFLLQYNVNAVATTRLIKNPKILAILF